MLRSLERAASLPVDAATVVVVASITSVKLLDANSARIGVVVHNDSASWLYVKYIPRDGPVGCSLTDFTTSLGQQASVRLDYAGRIDAIWDEAVGSARVTELL